MDLYAERGNFVRRRSVGHVLEEIGQVLATSPRVDELRFYDHAFADDPDWLAAFADEYARRHAVPWTCHVPLDAVSPAVAAALARGRCRGVRTHLGSGSRFIREEILSMRLGDEQIVKSCRLLREAGLAVCAKVYVGAPYESAITCEETLRLLRACRCDEVRPIVYYPTPGTRAAELCAENGWISGRGEENYWAGKSVLNMPSLSAEKIEQFARRLPGRVRAGRREMLGKLVRRLRGEARGSS